MGDAPRTTRPQGVLRRPRRCGLLLIGRLVVLVGERLEPGGGVCAVGEVLQHGEVAHEGVGGGAVPVLLVGRADDGVAGADPDDGTVAGADQADALGDVQRLADGVAVPVGAGAGGEPDQADGHPRRLGAAVDRGQVDVAGEVPGRRLDGRVDALEFHGCSSVSQTVSRVLMARRSSIAWYPSAACSSGRVRSKTLPGSMVRSQMSWMSSGRNRRTGAGPPCRCTPEKNSSSPGRVTSCETPTYPTWPPARVARMACVIDSWVPTASMVECAPRPPVSSLMRATPASPRSSTMSVAPNSRARACRSAWRLMAMMRSAPSSRAASTPRRPTAPSPTTATVLPGPASAATAANQPVPSTSEAARRLGMSSAEGTSGVATRVPSASGMRASSAWVPMAPTSWRWMQELW